MDRSKLLLWINTNLPTALHAIHKNVQFYLLSPLNGFGQIAPLICIDPIMDFEQSDIGFPRDIPILSDIIPFPRFIWFAIIMWRNKRHMIRGTSLDVYNTYVNATFWFSNTHPTTHVVSDFYIGGRKFITIHFRTATVIFTQLKIGIFSYILWLFLNYWCSTLFKF